MQPQPSLWSHRARLLLLVFALGWASLTIAALQLYLNLSTPWLTIWVVIALLVACFAAAARLMLLKRRPPDLHEAVEPGIDALLAEWHRLTGYARESLAHVLNVPLLLVTIGILLLIVMRDIPRSPPNYYLIILLGLAYVALVGGSLRATFGLLHEARRLKRIEAQIEASRAPE